jgi:phosphate acetyltransferase
LEFSGIVAKMAEKVKEKKRKIVLPETEDIRVLKAAAIVAKGEYANIILIGNEEEIKNKCEEENIDMPYDKVEIIDNMTSSKKAEYDNMLYELRKHKGMTIEQASKTNEDKVYFATMMVQAEDADGLVSGAIHSTANTLRPALQVIKAAEGIKNVSSFFLMETPKKELGTDGVMIFSDCGLIEFPTKEQLIDITIESAQSYKMLTGNEPKVALLSYSTKGSAKNEAIDKLTEVLGQLKDKNLDFDVDGEFQLDAAIIPEVAKLKAPDSKVAGNANVLIFPNLEAGNIGYKIAQRFGDALAIGPVTQGLRKPVNDLSRGSTVEDIVGTIIVTCMQVK